MDIGTGSRPAHLVHASLGSHGRAMREICASGIIMRPSGNDLANPEIRRYLGRYMRGKDVDVEYK